MEGIGNVKPQILKVTFKKRGYITLYLFDGRILHTPLNKFPAIENIPLQLRVKYQISEGDTLIFIHGDEVYHIQDFLGFFEDYKYSFSKKS